MVIEYDEARRAKTLQERGLDFADAGVVFDAPAFTTTDDRQAYGEARFVTYGVLDASLVVIVWTPRGAARRIISMRYANERERNRFQGRLG